MEELKAEASPGKSVSHFLKPDLDPEASWD